MPQAYEHAYDVLLTAKIEFGAKIEANSAAEAKNIALQMLRKEGELMDVEFERAILLTEEPNTEVDKR